MSSSECTCQSGGHALLCTVHAEEAMALMIDRVASGGNRFKLYSWDSVQWFVTDNGTYREMTAARQRFYDRYRKLGITGSAFHVDTELPMLSPSDLGIEIT